MDRPAWVRWLVIAIDAVSVRRKGASLSNVTLSLGPGVHALVGALRDGGPLLLSLLTGEVRPGRGRVRVHELLPTDARARRQVARIAMVPALPESMRVDEALSLAAALRGDPPGSTKERLAILGLESLAERSVHSLSSGEARALTLVEALTSPTVRTVLADEPLVGIDPRAAGLVPEALRAKGRDGCIVLTATASVRDAGELADEFVFLRSGVVIDRTTSLETLASPHAPAASLVLVAPDRDQARALVAALAASPNAPQVELDGPIVTLRGGDAVALARWGAHVAVQAEVNLVAMRIEPSLEGLP